MEKQSITMKMLPESERPYELLRDQGAETLTDAQLLAILLKSGVKGKSALELSREILVRMQNEFPSRNPLNALFSLPIYRLCEFDGIGEVKAVLLKSVSEVSNRIHAEHAAEVFDLSDPASVASLYPFSSLDGRAEHVWYLLVNSKLELISRKELCCGTLNQSLINERTIFLDGQEKGAYGFILLHNHPSGDPSPSREDDLLTEQLRKQGEIMRMVLLDHIIIGRDTYYSYAETGFPDPVSEET